MDAKAKSKTLEPKRNFTRDFLHSGYAPVIFSLRQEGDVHLTSEISTYCQPDRIVGSACLAKTKGFNYSQPIWPLAERVRFEPKKAHPPAFTAH